MEAQLLKLTVLILLNNKMLMVSLLVELHLSLDSQILLRLSVLTNEKMNIALISLTK